MTEIINIDPQTDPRWMKFIESDPDSSLFHHPVWIHLIESTYGFRSRCIGISSNEELRGILPLVEVRSWLTGKRAVCLPFSDTCFPLFDAPQIRDEMMSRCQQLLDEFGWRYFEIRGGDGAGLIRCQTFLSHRLALIPDTDTLFRSFHKTRVQQSIRRAEKEATTFERSTSPDAIAEYIRLNALTRRKHGLPPQPDRFFFNLQRQLLERGFGFVGVVRYAGHVIAATVFLMFQKTIYFKYSASDINYLHYKPNHLLMWNVIRWAASNGYLWMDFGRTEVANEGLLNYKKSWGTTEHTIDYFRFGTKVTEGLPGEGFELLSPFIRRLPIPLLKLLGRIIYPHLG